jgi:phospholipid/cholesterol/gamma-HCH transport system substrate-binding protein
MSMRAHPAAIGAFVVGAVALLLVALLVWGGTDLFRAKLNYVIFFDAAVTGLNKGAPVLARGVKVGEVTDIQIRWGTPLVAVYISCEPQAIKGTAEAGPARRIEQLVREEGLRAQLRMQSFVTGVLYVAFDFFPHTPIVLRGHDERVPELPTVPTDIEVWTAKLQRFAEKIDKVPLDQIGQTTAVILEEVKKIVESKATHDLLPNTNAAIGDARTLVRRVDAQIDPLFAQLKGTLVRFDAGLDAARKLARDVDSRVDPLGTQAEAALKAAQAALADVRPLIEDLRRLAAKLDAQADPALTAFRSAADSVRATMERAQLTLGGVDQTLEQGSPLGYELFQTFKDLRAAAQAVRSLADYLERVPDAVIYGVRRPSGGAK